MNQETINIVYNLAAIISAILLAVITFLIFKSKTDN